MRTGYAIGLALLPWLAGCASYVTHKIEHPARSHTSLQRAIHDNLQQQGFVQSSVRTSDGVRIAYWLGQPHAYAMHETFSRSADGANLQWQWQMPEAPFDGSLLPMSGSIVLLHPWEGEGAMLATWAYRFASAGYVTVMPDLRSQGDSDVAPVGYGPREGHDVAELVRRLRATRRLPEPLFLMGVSYGATVAVFAANELADVSGVIALEPYGNAAEVIRRAPSTGLFGPRWLGHAISGSSVDAAIARASSDLGVDLEHIDTASALQHAPCTLIVRGARDPLVSETILKALTASSSQARYVEVSSENHFSLPLRTDRLMQPLLDWLHALASPHAACPSFTPLPASESKTKGISDAGAPR
jgi:pimeloyl-ACP methyl ester carboxylesterase